MIQIQEQKWDKNYTRYLIVGDGASVHIGVYDKPQWFGSKAIIYALYTNDYMRNRGCAKVVMSVAERVIKDKGLSKVSIEFDPSESDNFVKEWYHRMGYEDFAYAENNLILVKKL